MRDPVHFLPILTTLLAFPFGITLLRRWHARQPAPHLAWWGAGILLYGVGTATEAATTLFGWNEAVFRAWYISGALLGAAPLAQGSVYLHLPRRSADRMTIGLLAFIAVAASLVLLAPVDPAMVEPYRLSGRVFAWQRVRLFSPFVNLYAAVFLIGTAAWSAIRFSRRIETRQRAIGNTWIAIGALLPGIGGTATRMGYTEVLYVTELVGLLLIAWGYRTVVRTRAHPSVSGHRDQVPAPG
ncbi:MAG: hypothetical protein L0271_08940 [Gemmatimonadetes bacterium]|nr:hypothetical protein [Gemmatimonadota bacterium]